MMPRDLSVFVHDRALCESSDLGARTRSWAFAHVMKGARIGSDCNVGDHAFVESGARIGDRVTIKNCVLVWDKVTVEDEVFLGPNVVFTNDMNPRIAFKKSPDAFLPTLVKRGASIGANVTIVCGTTIGEQAFVGAASSSATSRPTHWLWETPHRMDVRVRGEAPRHPRLPLRPPLSHHQRQRRPRAL
jgi:UDP-2-acetamido-3-amino-2,3-dideoxy-glucuronate N-acetyltransferase